ICDNIVRHFREVYEKVHNALWRAGSQVVSAKQLTGSCITLFRTPHATSIQLSRFKIHSMSFPTLLLRIATGF
ncbi:hypothetical protein V2W45_1241188, partial [Cenococcum geophilum]